MPRSHAYVPGSSPRRHGAAPQCATILLLLLAACGGGAAPQGDGGGLDAQGSEGGEVGAPSRQFAKVDPAQLFDSAEVPTFELKVAPADVQKMHDDAAQWYELQKQGLDLPYVPADLFFRGEYVGRVGLRHKGTFGTLKLCFEGTKQICPKLSFKIKFDEYDDNLRFFSMKRINLHSMVRDGSMMHERLGYGLFRDMGVPASRSAHARVVINGAPQGIFSMVEQVEGHMTKAAFGGEGNIYKEVWPASTDASYYNGGLDNNSAAPDHSKIIAFAGELAAAAPEELPAMVEKWVGADHMLRYMAVLEAIRYWDSIVAFYCGAGNSTCGNHNYYWYQDDRADGTTKFRLIPWDLDNTWALATAQDAAPRWYEGPVDCTSRYDVGSAETTVWGPRCDRFMDGVARLSHDAFVQRIGTLLDGPFQTEALLAKVDAWSTQIAAAVAEDPNLPGGETGWRSEVARLKRDIPLLRQRLIRLRDGSPVVPFGLSLSAPMNMEGVDALDVAVALEYYASSGTDFLPGLNTVTPLAGTADLRIDFEYRNTDEPWGQWTQLNVPFVNHTTVDLSDVKEIRIKLRSNASRTLRIDLRSPLHTQDAKAYRFGWDIPVGPTAQDIVLPIASASMPSWASPVPPDRLSDVLTQVTGFTFHPNCAGRGATGFLPAGTTDKGYLEVDDILFVMK